MAFTPDPLKSSNPLEIALILSDNQIAIIHDNNNFGGKIVADRLFKLREAVWSGNEFDKLDEKQKAKIFDDAIEGLDKTQQEQLISSYAKMGHLYEIASLAARSNFLKDIKRNPATPPLGGAQDFVKKNANKTTEQIIEKLGQPVFEVVMTAHPTNVNSIETMQAQREIDKALEIEDSDKLNAALTKALEHYQKTPLLHQEIGSEGVKKDANLTVRDETNTALYFLGNIYEDLPKVYENFDSALSKHPNNQRKAYDKTKLKLNTNFGSWGSSGDKDGNSNVNAKTTLEAIALHTQAILERYRDDLERTNSPELKEWKNTFDTKLSELNPLVIEIEKLTDDAKKSGTLTAQQLNDKFDELEQKLVIVRSGLDAEKFAEDLKKTANIDQEALNLLRRVRTFGFNFSKIEYRETAKEYGRVVGELVEGYKDLSPEQKVAKLTALLQEPDNQAAALFKAKAQAIIEAGAGKKYDGEDANPIAYHTLKRMALARDFGDVIKDNVLAECGQLEFPNEPTRKPTEAETTAQGVANILEAQFLQRAVEKDGKRPKLGIVPLFEEPETMKHIAQIMKAAYDNKAYTGHLKDVQEANSAKKPTQQVMIAHSDNARRSGLQAARAYIHDAHHKIRELNKERAEEGKETIQTQFFEGGSISDAYRNGVRAISASVNAFGLHDFAKFTFQGGDLLNYFNNPDSTARLLERQISHQADMFTHPETGNEWTVKIKGRHAKSPVAEVEKEVVLALKETLHDYQEHDFTQETMGVLMEALGYKKTVENSNAGSRAGSRTVAFAAGSTYGIGAAATSTGTPKKPSFIPVPIDKVRTIGFSKTWQGSGIVPSWIGSLDLKKHLDKSSELKLYFAKQNGITANTEDEKKAITEKPLDTTQIREIYDKSPTFRDAQDRSAFAIALTDMDAAKKIAKAGLQNAGDSQKKAGSDYLERVEKTYKAAADLAYSAITGKNLNSSNLSNQAIRDKMVEALPYLQEDIINKTNYRSAILHWQINHPELLADPHMGRIAQCAKDTVEHGRWLGASDPTYAQQKNNGVAIA